MTIKQFGFLMAASMAASLSFAQGSSELSLELVTSYSKSTDSIQVDGKSASFKTGGAGLKLRLDTASLGSFYTVAGGGYLPKQSASFAGVELTGPSDSLFYGVGYSYDFHLSNRLAVSLVSDYVYYDISGDLDGEAFGQPVTADVDSTVTMLDSSIALHYSVSRDLSAVVGLGVKRWSLDATADGELSGFTVSTSVAADNTDPHFYIGAEFAISHVPVGIYYRRSQLSADNSVDLNGVDIRILLMEF
jgi:hypothetical protein|tara:strand:- start:876 stop:1616 length:741 start_codon:yes stop_codon:yes gene_type:complete